MSSAGHLRPVRVRYAQKSFETDPETLKAMEEYAGWLNMDPADVFDRYPRKVTIQIAPNRAVMIPRHVVLLKESQH